MSVFDEAKRLHPDSWWWIKADAFDLFSGLGTSVEGEWNGDVNIHCDELEKCREDHLKRVQSIKNIDTSSLNLYDQIRDAIEDLKCDINFIDASMWDIACLKLDIFILLLALKSLHSECEKAFSQDGQEKHNLKLAWEMTGLTELNTFGRQLIVDSSIILEKLKSQHITDKQEISLISYQTGSKEQWLLLRSW